LSSRRSLIAGNWKMNGLRADGLALAATLARRAIAAAPLAADLLVCPPATLIREVAAVLDGSGVAVGGQDCHAAVTGPHTGDVSAPMLADAGARYVIVGHSERRRDHGESDALVAAKAAAAGRAGLIPIICVGESEAERDAGQAHSVIAHQLVESLPGGSGEGEIVIAYEPVWAIGTGRTATPEDIAAMHAHIRVTVSRALAPRGGLRILYGGSVNPANARAILALDDVGGALVGGASLKADDFWSIALSCS
jgi:triosephosphate isomerase